MLALADAADKENRMASPASALPPLTTPKPKGKPKHKKSTNKQRITAGAWKADKVVQRMIKEKAMKDVTDLEGLNEFICDYTHLRNLENSMHEKERLAVLYIQQDARLQDRRQEADARLKKEKEEWRAHRDTKCVTNRVMLIYRFMRDETQGKRRDM